MEQIKKKVNSVIYEQLIFINTSVNNKDQAINLITKKAYELNLIKDTDSIIKTVYKREQEASTAVGLEVAIPHGKSSKVNKPLIGFIQLAKPIKWNEEEVKLVFMILVPDNSLNNMHLKFISKLSKNLIDKRFREELLNSKDVISVYKLLSSIEF